MIKLFNLNVTQFIYQYLPVHKRRPNRLSLLQVIIAPFIIMMNQFIPWRNAAMKRSYAGWSELSLEWLLNDQLNPDNTYAAIYIDSAPASGTYVGLNSTAEAATSLNAGMCL
jgi:hypothetical protein